MIKIEGLDPCIYKHSDGYPEGVVPVLRAFLPKFMKYRGWDSSYMLARLLGAFLEQEKVDRAEFDARREERGFMAVSEENRAESNCLGYGIEPTVNHFDIEWLYVITERRVLEVRQVREDFGQSLDVKDTKVTKRIKF
jgi:hypothetical protein